MTAVIVAFLLTLLPVFARAAEHAHAEEHHGIPWAKLLFSIINLSIFLYILRRSAWPLIRDWIASRRDQVVEALEHAARAKREAEQLQAEWQNRLANLAAELDAMRARARADIEAERDRILAAAQQLAEGIRRDARRTADQELRTAERLLRTEVAEQGLRIASSLAAQRLTPADHERFVGEFIAQVEQ